MDGRGRRVGKKLNGTLVKQWLWRGQLQPVAELDGAGNVVARFVYAARVNVPALMVTSAGTYRLVADQLGSVRAVIDASTGAVAQEIIYDAWGRVVSDSSPGLQPFGFAGGIVDKDSALVRFGARDYDPQIGRWTTKDPIRFNGGINLYGYSLSDPINRRDPRGLEVTQCCGSAEYGGSVGEYLPPHCWICTDDRCVGLTGTIWDTVAELHPESVTESVYPDAQCEEIPSVDEQCVNSVLEDDLERRHLGLFHPYNNCITYVGEVINQCYDWGPFLSEPDEYGPCLGCGEGM